MKNVQKDIVTIFIKMDNDQVTTITTRYISFAVYVSEYNDLLFFNYSLDWKKNNKRVSKKVCRLRYRRDMWSARFSAVENKNRCKNEFLNTNQS